MASTTDLEKLASLLERRLSVIGNHGLRDTNPDEHLRQLQEVSEAIVEWHKEFKGSLKPRLEHFMQNCSYENALDWIRQELA